MTKKTPMWGLFALPTLLIFLNLLSPDLTAASAAAGETSSAGLALPNPGRADAPLAMVALFHTVEDVEALRRQLPDTTFLGFSALDALKEGAGNDILVVLPLLERAKLELFGLEYNEYNRGGELVRGSVFARAPLGRSSAYVLRTTIPEGIPNLLALCLTSQGREHCLPVQYDGVDGGLVYAGGFVPWRRESGLELGQDVQSGAGADGRFVFDSAAPHYANARYGFSLSLPPGEYQAKISDNGDGLSVEDGRGLLLRAYGTKCPGVLGQGFEEVLAETAQGL
ncbi:MAG: hypothetical protein Q4G66_05750 [bacterium]|nr:hypothetical protein [bacterium]